MESFFALLQRDVLDRQRWSTRARTTTGDGHLDRAHLPPPPTATRPWPAHRDRVRTAPHPSGNRGLKFTPRGSTKPGAVPAVVYPSGKTPEASHTTCEALECLGTRLGYDLLPAVAGRQPAWEALGSTPMSDVSSVTRSRTRLRSVDSESAVCGAGFTEASMSKTVCGRCHAENHSRPRP